MAFDAAIFGSQARGSADANSDFDVIAVVSNAVSIDREKISETVNRACGRSVGLSIYSSRRLREMWKIGSPFAWHLHLEAKPLTGFPARFLSWSPPEKYEAAQDDCLQMVGVLRDSIEQLGRSSSTVCYEAGLIYVVARNIGMFASNELGGGFDFSRNAPFAIQGCHFPLSRDEFETLRAARHATTRGTPVPLLIKSAVLAAGERVLRWGSEVVDAINREIK